MSKLLKLSVAALAVLAIALPTMAQDSKARTFSLKTKDVKGQVITETEEETGTNVVDLGGGALTQTTEELTLSTQTTEIVEVGENGQRTQARVGWTEHKTTTTVQDFGQEKPGEAAETEGAKKGASILWTMDKDKKWSSKVEKGDAEELKGETKKTKPFANPLVPERDVKLGEEWAPTEDELKEAFPPSDEMSITELKCTCKAEEVVKEGEKEYLKVTFSIEGKGKLANEQLGNPEFSIKNTGHYLWDIAEGRVSSVESEREMGFETEVETEMGKTTAKFTGTGKSKITMTYGKKD
jgi:hypothetical protein